MVIVPAITGTASIVSKERGRDWEGEGEDRRWSGGDERSVYRIVVSVGVGASEVVQAVL